MSAVETMAIAYLLAASSGTVDLAQYSDVASVELLRDRGLLDGDCKLTELGRQRSRLIGDFSKHLDTAAIGVKA